MFFWSRAGKALVGEKGGWQGRAGPAIPGTSRSMTGGHLLCLSGDRPWFPPCTHGPGRAPARQRAGGGPVPPCASCLQCTSPASSFPYSWLWRFSETELSGTSPLPPPAPWDFGTGQVPLLTPPCSCPIDTWALSHSELALCSPVLHSLPGHVTCSLASLASSSPVITHLHRPQSLTHGHRGLWTDPPQCTHTLPTHVHTQHGALTQDRV